MACIKVKPWGEGQGDHVLIEEENFDSSKHALIEEEAAAVVTPLASGGDGPQKTPKNKA
jgi:hypothetical protein